MFFKKVLTGKLLTVTVAAATLGAGSAALAQHYDAQAAQRQYESQQAQETFPGQTQQFNVDQEQLVQFVAVEKEIRGLQGEFQQEMNQATTPEEISAIQNRMNTEMIRTIEQSDLTVDEYNLVLTAIQSDQQTREQYIQLAR